MVCRSLKAQKTLDFVATENGKPSQASQLKNEEKFLKGSSGLRKLSCRGAKDKREDASGSFGIIQARIASGSV